MEKKKKNYVQETNKQNEKKKKKKKKYKRTADIRCHKEFCTWEGREKRGRKRNSEVEHVNTKKASKLQTGGSKSH